MKETRKLISNSGVIFVGTLVGSFFSYLFNMLTGRLLGPELYGDFTTIMSLMMILSVAGGAVTTVTMKYSSELYAKGEIDALKKLFGKFSRYVFIFALCLVVACMILARPIENFFSITEYFAIVLAFFSFFFGFLTIVNRGVLQGGQKFLALAITNPMEMILRLTLGVFFIKIGLSLSGAMMAIVLSGAIIYFITLIPLRKLFREKDLGEKEFKFNKREILGYTLPALVSSILLMFALNIDIFLVKHFFDSETAGIYAAVSTIAKIVLYATAPVVSVMFPMILEKKTVGEKHYKLFFSSIILTVLAAFVILIVYMVAPGTVIRILYGSKYVVYYYLLPKVGFFILLYSLINIMVNYFLAIKDFIFTYIFAFVLVLQVFLINLKHDSLDVVISSLILTSGLLFVLLTGYYLITKKEQLKSYFQGNYGKES